MCKILFIFTFCAVIGATILSIKPHGIEILEKRYAMAADPNKKEEIKSWLKATVEKLNEAKKEIFSFFEGEKTLEPFDREEYLRNHLAGLRKVEENFAEMIREKARQKDVSEKIAIALAVAESDGRPGITNENNDGSIDKGLYQLNSRGFGANFSDDILFDPEKNTEIALDSLAALIKKYGDEETAIIAYKIGWGNVDSLMRINNFNKENYRHYKQVAVLAERVTEKGGSDELSE